jgi:hypothetical protein
MIPSRSATKRAARKTTKNFVKKRIIALGAIKNTLSQNRAALIGDEMRNTPRKDRGTTNDNNQPDTSLECGGLPPLHPCGYFSKRTQIEPVQTHPKPLWRSKIRDFPLKRKF